MNTLDLKEGPMESSRFLGKRIDSLEKHFQSLFESLEKGTSEAAQPMKLLSQ